jgi:hypothetical protein
VPSPAAHLRLLPHALQQRGQQGVQRVAGGVGQEQALQLAGEAEGHQLRHGQLRRSIGTGRGRGGMVCVTGVCVCGGRGGRQPLIWSYLATQDCCSAC